MSLGTNLVVDIYNAVKPSDDASKFASGFATAVNNYLAGAEYGEGALTWTGATTEAMFQLPPPASATAATAAQAIGLGVMSYWTPAGVATGVPATPTQEEAVVSGQITATTVSTDVTAGLTTIFSDLKGGQYWTNQEVSDHTSITGDDLEPYDKNTALIVLNTTEGKWYQRKTGAWAEVTDTKAHQIAKVISDAVAGVVVAWIEQTPASSPVPLTGGVT